MESVKRLSLDLQFRNVPDETVSLGLTAPSGEAQFGNRFKAEGVTLDGVLRAFHWQQLRLSTNSLEVHGARPRNSFNIRLIVVYSENTKILTFELSPLEEGFLMISLGGHSQKSSGGQIVFGLGQNCIGLVGA